MTDMNTSAGELQQGFPQFALLPTEIQHKIFTEAICKPNIHFVIAKRNDNPATGKWHLKLFPVPKGKDASGYRLLEPLASVSEEASKAVHLATAKVAVRSEAERGDGSDQVQWAVDTVPFKLLNNRFDGGEDLVCFQFQRTAGKVFDYFHPDHQIVNPSAFDPDAQAEQFKSFQKVAIVSQGHDPHCTSDRSVFRCVGHNHHWNWTICPEQLCAFLDCFPNLRELYIIMKQHNEVQEKEECKMYAKNFFTLTSATRRHRALSIFHATDRSYIELHDNLMLSGPSRRATAPTTERFYPMYMGRARQQATMLQELKQYFLLDAEYLPYEQQDRAVQYRLPRKQREGLVMKFLLPTATTTPEGGEVQGGWAVWQREGSLFREMNLGGEAGDGAWVNNSGGEEEGAGFEDEGEDEDGVIGGGGD